MQLGHATINQRPVARWVATNSIFGPGTYNIASGVETSVQSVVDQLLAVANLDVTFTPKPARPADIRRAYADVSRLAALGFRPTTPLKETLTNMLGYYSGWPAG